MRRGLAAPRTPRALGSALGMLARPPGTSCRRTKTAGTGRRLHEHGPAGNCWGFPGPDAPPVRYGWRRERKELLWPPRHSKKKLLGVPRPRRQPPVTNAMLLLGSHHCRGRCSRGTIRASGRVLPVALVLNTDGGWCLLGSHHCRGTRAGRFGCSRRKNSRNCLQPKK